MNGLGPEVPIAAQEGIMGGSARLAKGGKGAKCPGSRVSQSPSVFVVATVRGP